ncbi:hypothetical protein AMTRI_Chr12g270900 [Amborella trichopoda]
MHWTSSTLWIFFFLFFFSWVECKCACWDSSQGCSVQDTPHECPHSDLPSVVNKYMKKVHVTWRSSSHIQSHYQSSIRLLNTCSKGMAFAASFEWKSET